MKNCNLLKASSGSLDEMFDDDRTVAQYFYSNQMTGFQPHGNRLPCSCDRLQNFSF